MFHRDTGNDCTLETCEVVVGRKLYELNPRHKYLQHKVGNYHRFIARLAAFGAVRCNGSVWRVEFSNLSIDVFSDFYLHPYLSSQSDRGRPFLNSPFRLQAQACHVLDRNPSSKATCRCPTVRGLQSKLFDTRASNKPAMYEKYCCGLRSKHVKIPALF